MRFYGQYGTDMPIARWRTICLASVIIMLFSSVSRIIWFVENLLLASFSSGVACIVTQFEFSDIVWLAEFDLAVTGVEWVLLANERSKLISIPPARRLTEKRTDRTEVTEGVHNEIRPFFWEDCVHRSMSRDFSKWARSCSWRMVMPTGSV